MKLSFVSEEDWERIPEDARRDFCIAAARRFPVVGAVDEAFWSAHLEYLEGVMFDFFGVDQENGLEWSLLDRRDEEGRRFALDCLLRLRDVGRLYPQKVLEAPCPGNVVWVLAELPLEKGACPYCLIDAENADSDKDISGQVHVHCRPQLTEAREVIGSKVVEYARTVPLPSRSATGISSPDEIEIDVDYTDILDQFADL